MAEKQTFDENNLDTFENHETSKKLPLGWVILFICLIVFGIYYFFAYTPNFTGWTQERAYQESIK